MGVVPAGRDHDVVHALVVDIAPEVEGEVGRMAGL